MEQDAIDFLSDVQYFTKEEYLAAMHQLKKDWKKVYTKITNDIRALKYGEKSIGINEISWRSYEIAHTVVDAFGYSPEEIEAFKKEIKQFAKKAGVFQSIRAECSKQATQMIESYMEQKAYLKKCAHYSYTLDRLLEDSNRRFC